MNKEPKFLQFFNTENKQIFIVPVITNLNSKAVGKDLKQTNQTLNDCYSWFTIALHWFVPHSF